MRAPKRRATARVNLSATRIGLHVAGLIVVMAVAYRHSQDHAVGSLVIATAVFALLCVEIITGAIRNNLTH